MSKLGKKIQSRACVFTFSVEIWSLRVAVFPRTGKKCTEIKGHVKSVQSFQAFAH